ncbi:hypothetical protein QTP88_011847 [Uroleucon formosanum]
MDKYCSIPDCRSSLKEVMLYRIPPLTKEYSEIAINWIQLILNSYPNYSLDNICYKYVCSKHFKDQCFIPSDRALLKSFAIPTEFKSRRDVFFGFNRCQMNNTAADMNTIRDISVIRNNNVYTNANSNCVTEPSVPNPSDNTIEMKLMTRNVFNRMPTTEHADLQEPSEQIVEASSRSLRTRKRKLVCGYCCDSEVHMKRIKRV